MNINQGFKYTDSSTYDFTNVDINDNGLSLFDSLTGIGGIDFIPYDGSSVTVYSGNVNSDPNIKDLQPSLNNKAYYLVTDVVYKDTDKDLIISLATPISLTLYTYLQDDVLDTLLDDVEDPLIGTYSGATSGNVYVGTFVFNNPNDYEYLYLIWDYTDSLNGGTASYEGVASTKYIDVDFGSDIGNAAVDYIVDPASGPARFILKYNNNNVGDTGYVGLNSVTNYNALIALGIPDDEIALVSPYDGLVDNGTGSINFNKYLPTGEGLLTAYSPLVLTKWDLARVDPTLTSFYINTSAGTSANVCAQAPITNYYHDGLGATPTVGDRVYTVSDGTVTFDGTSSYHLISSTYSAIPPISGGKFVVVNADGVCVLYGECDCTEVAIPVIDQVDINIVQNKFVNLIFSATNNPTSWEVVSSCNNYVLNGGTKGSIFAIVDCDSVARNVTVNVNTDVTVCTTALPTLSFGDGTITAGTACMSSILPQGLSFDINTGILSGTPVEACEYAIELIATNCFGDSVNATVNISVATGIQLTPFAVDVENFSDSGAGACVLTPVYSLLYHNGIGNIPDVNDDIFLDHRGIDLFMGGSRWYNIDISTYSIKICETGKVCDTNVC